MTEILNKNDTSKIKEYEDFGKPYERKFYAVYSVDRC